MDRRGRREGTTGMLLLPRENEEEDERIRRNVVTVD